MNTFASLVQDPVWKWTVPYLYETSSSLMFHKPIMHFVGGCVVRLYILFCIILK